MNKPRYLVTGDPVSKLTPHKDTSILLMSELLRRGMDVDYCDLFKTNPSQNSEDFLKQLPVQEVLYASNEDASYIGLAPKRLVDANSTYNVVINRKDPPVDQFFIDTHTHLGKLSKHILQINHAAEIWKHEEHVLPTRFPQYAQTTYVCKSFDEFVDAVKACKTEAVCKPHNSAAGRGIEFFPASASREELEGFYKKNAPTVVVQPYLPEIKTEGDLRIFVMNGKVIGNLLRTTPPGGKLANLVYGGKGLHKEVSDFHREVARVVADELRPLGIYLIGLDMIGGKLTEVNITSPTGLVNINAVAGIEGHIQVVDEIEALRIQKQTEK